MQCAASHRPTQRDTKNTSQNGRLLYALLFPTSFSVHRTTQGENVVASVVCQKKKYCITFQMTFFRTTILSINTYNLNRVIYQTIAANPFQKRKILEKNMVPCMSKTSWHKHKSIKINSQRVIQLLVTQIYRPLKSR